MTTSTSCKSASSIEGDVYCSALVEKRCVTSLLSGSSSRLNFSATITMGDVRVFDDNRGICVDTLKLLGLGASPTKPAEAELLRCKIRDSLNGSDEKDEHEYGTVDVTWALSSR